MEARARRGEVESYLHAVHLKMLDMSRQAGTAGGGAGTGDSEVSTNDDVEVGVRFPTPTPTRAGFLLSGHVLCVCGGIEGGRELLATRSVCATPRIPCRHRVGVCVVGPGQRDEAEADELDGLGKRVPPKFGHRRSDSFRAKSMRNAHTVIEVRAAVGGPAGCPRGVQQG